MPAAPPPCESGAHRRRVRDVRHLPDPDRFPHDELEPAEILEGRADPRPPLLDWHTAQVHAVDQNRAAIGLVKPA